jgi:alpha-amylase/alpha-mannosidase (GH57 family)
MQQKEVYLVIHGHFYQPPREDPYTGEIDLQDSAYPWHDWNERITDECYRSMVFSRVLNGFGKIERIVNNYEYISFNFGPTLLVYLEKYHKKVYEKILEADYNSRNRNNGHGNAIAQAYNHMILPLASDRDKITQIEWGLRDFEKRFGRTSEGMWLPEAAVNDIVVQFLIDYGIKFVILSPHQVEKVKVGQNWVDVSKGDIDFSKPYILKEPNGEIVVFFYNGYLSHAVSFNHLLRSAEGFKSAILSQVANINSQKVFLSIATDGEVYGHHEPFGDMCLSYLVTTNEIEKVFNFTNFANVIDIIKPTQEVILKKGHNSLGTSWSCAHGVDRWYRDCGCTTGSQPGWNQAWREPLRNAFDYLRDELYSLAEVTIGSYLKDIWKARNDYIDLVFIRSSLTPNQWEKHIEDFLSSHKAQELTKDQRETVLKFLEALYNEMLMYTSCGWFFADISGIETVQVMRYASYIFYLLEDHIRPEVKNRFLEILSKAKSNIAQFNDGRWIFENWIEKYKFTPDRVVAQFVLYKYLLGEKNLQKSENYYYYTIVPEKSSVFTSDGFEVLGGVIKVINNVTLEKNNYIYYIFISYSTGELHIYTKEHIYDGFETYIEGVIKDLDFIKVKKFFNDWFAGGYTLLDLKYEVREAILYKLFEKQFKSLRINTDFDISDYIKVIENYSLLGVKLPDEEKVLISYLFKEYIDKQSDQLLNGKGMDAVYLLKVIKISRDNDLKIPMNNLEKSLYTFLDRKVDEVISSNGESGCEDIVKITDFVSQVGIGVYNRREIENKLYDFLESPKGISKLIQEAQGDKNKLEKIKKILDVCERFNLSTYRYRKGIL